MVDRVLVEVFGRNHRLDHVLHEILTDLLLRNQPARPKNVASLESSFALESEGRFQHIRLWTIDQVSWKATRETFELYDASQSVDAPSPTRVLVKIHLGILSNREEAVSFRRRDRLGVLRRHHDRVHAVRHGPPLAHAVLAPAMEKASRSVRRASCSISENCFVSFHVPKKRRVGVGAAPHVFTKIDRSLHRSIDPSICPRESRVRPERETQTSSCFATRCGGARDERLAVGPTTLTVNRLKEFLVEFLREREWSRLVKGREDDVEFERDACRGLGGFPYNTLNRGFLKSETKETRPSRYESQKRTRSDTIETAERTLPSGRTQSKILPLRTSLSRIASLRAFFFLPSKLFLFETCKFCRK